eukprot:CAMPEP_0114411258 /NCGR_PEP_ID=MMETSP0102-20121206/24558_1 /TAXON_ID=38822 ORGANISM="Pteridomonas danica, Strain PT" /NCGR_SAMPLE_ID=MMETSP0102 /ASSEMBLY_ACC=CAM_ASM_000212 /LENGTH=117 /DNA_ID=CAMNT_0001579137 /DNA_START=90 /DNA_END=443 /DNA_ORIENTATION=+
MNNKMIIVCLKPTSGVSFLSCRNECFTAIGGYVSLIANLPPQTSTECCLYYEVEIVELGGAGRDVLNPLRSESEEGGQVTIGWATSHFRGESHAYRGVGDDRNSWGLRAGGTRHNRQ